MSDQSLLQCVRERLDEALKKIDTEAKELRLNLRGLEQIGEGAQRFTITFSHEGKENGNAMADISVLRYSIGEILKSTEQEKMRVALKLLTPTGLIALTAGESEKVVGPLYGVEFFDSL